MERDNNEKNVVPQVAATIVVMALAFAGIAYWVLTYAVSMASIG